MLALRGDSNGVAGEDPDEAVATAEATRNPEQLLAEEKAGGERWRRKLEEDCPIGAVREWKRDRGNKEKKN